MPCVSVVSLSVVVIVIMISVGGLWIARLSAAAVTVCLSTILSQVVLLVCSLSLSMVGMIARVVSGPFGELRPDGIADGCWVRLASDICTGVIVGRSLRLSYDYCMGHDW